MNMANSPLSPICKKLEMRRQNVTEVSFCFTQEHHGYDSNSAVINHSDRIALKYGKNQWLECNGNCASSDCPGLVMDRDDWTDCRDETFRIYRMGGRYRSDIIQCGSYVALYQGFTVSSGAWLGCANTRCSIGTCPGLPSIGIGNGIVGIHNKVFQTCWGEVFIIYARGKTLGEPITENDYIMLYYPRDQNYVSLWPNQPYAHHETCPGTARPPGTDKYNDCVGEVLQIIKR